MSDHGFHYDCSGYWCIGRRWSDAQSPCNWPDPNTGSGAVPSGMLVILAILLESLGFPLEIVGLVAGVHAFNDMGMTMINCLGDLSGTIIVGHKEKQHAV